jgi:hypothetical protein
MMGIATSKRFAVSAWAAPVLGALCVLGYQHATRNPPAPAVEVRNQGPARSALPATGPLLPSSPNVDPNPSVSVGAPMASGTAAVPIEQAIIDARSPDPRRRAAAILALAQGPSDRAVPVLRRVLKNGDFASEGQLALASLRTLALNSGDDDGAIRDVLREVTYHTSGESSEGAQATLEEIEEQIAASAPE